MLAAKDEVGANFYMYMAQTLGGYNDTVSRIEDISVIIGLTMARAQNGQVIIPFPLDHGVWSQRGSEIVNHLVTTYRAQTGFTGGFDLWVAGTVTPLAHKGLAGMGVAVTENVGEQLRMSYVRKLVTELSGGVFGYLDSVLERHSFDEFGELI